MPDTDIAHRCHIHQDTANTIHIASKPINSTQRPNDGRDQGKASYSALNSDICAFNFLDLFCMFLTLVGR